MIFEVNEGSEGIDFLSGDIKKIQGGGLLYVFDDFGLYVMPEARWVADASGWSEYSNNGFIYSFSKGEHT